MFFLGSKIDLEQPYLFMEGLRSSLMLVRHRSFSGLDGDCEVRQLVGEACKLVKVSLNIYGLECVVVEDLELDVRTW